MNKKIIIILIILVGIFLVYLGFQPKQVAYTFKRISEQEAFDLFIKSDENYIILDVREPIEYKEGHIVKAVNLPLGQIESKAKTVLKDKNQTIYVYCRSGNRSVSASTLLSKMGYNNIIEFGGINNWPGSIIKD